MIEACIRNPDYPQFAVFEAARGVGVTPLRASPVQAILISCIGEDVAEPSISKDEGGPDIYLVPAPRRRRPAIPAEFERGGRISTRKSEYHNLVEDEHDP